MYKIISRVIVKRLKPLFKHIIALEKMGFMEGHQILNGIGTTHEVVHCSKNIRRCGMVIKLDLSKEYDRLS